MSYLKTLVQLLCWLCMFLAFAQLATFLSVGLLELWDEYPSHVNIALLLSFVVLCPMLWMPVHRLGNWLYSDSKI